VPESTPSRAQTVSTPARIALGRTGASLPTREQLRFQLDHALARDAVHAPLDLALIERGLAGRGLEPLALRSAAPDRHTYLQRPDLGRTLHPASAQQMRDLAAQGTQAPDVLFILAHGLSALALERHALPLLDAVFALIPNPCSLIPVVTQARVAIGDEIGELLGARLTVLLIGERPGLSSPDSLGAYLTWNPRSGRTDAERNCVSNIRQQLPGEAGLSYAEAAQRIVSYIEAAHRLQTTGVALKEAVPSPALGG
jgi:ethanolamine ammonia-lyase small subunit